MLVPPESMGEFFYMYNPTLYLDGDISFAIFKSKVLSTIKVNPLKYN